MSFLPVRKSCGCPLNTYCMHGAPDMDDLITQSEIEEFRQFIKDQEKTKKKKKRTRKK